MIDDALSGIRVVALEQAVALPFCTLILAALGAEVIKVEPAPRGDVLRGWDDAVRGLSTGFVAFNADKKDIAVNAKTPAGRAVLQRLATSADVFVENFAPGAAARLGVGADELRRADPALVYCSLSGYGQDGPYRDVKAYDLLVQGESGLLLTNGSPDSPAKVGIPVTDEIAGMHAALAVVAALQRRARTGEGAHLDIAMLDSSAFWLGYYPHHWWHRKTEPPRSGLRHQYLAPYGPYRAADGRYVNLVIASDVDWRRFCLAVGRERWIEDDRLATVAARSRNRELVDSLVAKLVAGEPAGRWFDRLAGAGLPHGRVRTIGEALEHPQLRSRDLIVEADSPVGPVPVVRFPLGSGRRPRIPALGEHTDEVLTAVGYSSADIEQLRKVGAVV